MLKAARIQAEVDSRGMGWDRVKDVLAKIEEEIAELRGAVDAANMDKAYEEIGDILFSIVSVCRFLDVNPDTALDNSTNKFSKRIARLEEYLHSTNKRMECTNPRELDMLWERVKHDSGNSQSGCG